MSDTTYVLLVAAKPGHSEDVAKFFRDLEPSLRDSKGFQKRQIFQVENGIMARAMKKYFLGEEVSEEDGLPTDKDGTRFVVIETWDSVENRMLFSKSLSKDRNQGLLPHLLPEHSHEFYKDISVA